MRALLQRCLAGPKADSRRLISANRAPRTVFPPVQHVELRFKDGSVKVVDPRSREALALGKLAAELRQSG